MAPPRLTPRKVEYLWALHGLGNGWHRVDLVGALLDVGNGDAADMCRRLYAGGWVRTATPSQRIRGSSAIQLTPAGRMVVREWEQAREIDDD